MVCVSIVGGTNIPFAIPECRAAHLVERRDDHLAISVRLDAASDRCPECGQPSASVHRHDRRHPADLPLPASRTMLRIEVRGSTALRQHTWLLVRSSVSDRGEAAVVSRVVQDETARPVTGLARRFAPLVRDAGKGNTVVGDQDDDAAADLTAWIAQARGCDARAIATFASGLDADLAGPSRLPCRSHGAAA